MAKLFDTHAHYTDEKLCAMPELLAEALSDDVGGLVTVATDLSDSEACIELAAGRKNVWASAGIHPHECAKAGDPCRAAERLRDLLRDEKAVAIGEIGLDYHYDFSDRETQMRFFLAQMDLAAETGYPVIIHDREAHGDVFDVVRLYRGRVRGIIHSCSASAEQVREYVKLGWYISFSGVITFKNAASILDSVRATPKDRILVETDCPYLSPVPVRGKLNHSGYLHYTAEKAAELLGMEYAEFCDTEFQNALAIFQIRQESEISLP